MKFSKIYGFILSLLLIGYISAKTCSKRCFEAFALIGEFDIREQQEISWTPTEYELECYVSYDYAKHLKFKTIKGDLFKLKNACNSASDKSLCYRVRSVEKKPFAENRCLIDLESAQEELPKKNKRDIKDDAIFTVQEKNLVAVIQRSNP